MEIIECCTCGSESKKLAYRFSVDIDKTAEYYAAEHKILSPCIEVIRPALAESYPKLCEFLRQFGITPENPSSCSAVRFTDGRNKIRCSMYYPVFGKVEHFGKMLEIEDTIIEGQKRRKPPEGYPLREKTFGIWVCNTVFDWQLDTPLSEIYPEQEEQTFGQWLKAAAKKKDIENKA